MDIEQLLEVYKEYEVIKAQYSSNIISITENDNLISITLSTLPTIEELENLATSINEFKVHFNPSSEDIYEIIDLIKESFYKISDIKDITLLFTKKKLEEVDAYFFDYSDINQLINISFEERNKLNIGIFKIEKNVETEIINFISYKNLNNIKKIEYSDEINEKIKFYLSVNKKINHTMSYNPFTFKTAEDNSEIDEYTKTFINYLNIQLYYMFLESISDKHSEESFLIRGEKSIHITKSNNFSVDNIVFLKEIIEFLVTENKYTEKYLIVKNVLTIYLSDQEEIELFDLKLDKIWKTIHHYYNHYIEDNIKEFFKTKDQLLKEAMNVSKVVYEQTDKINTSIVASLFSVLILVATTIFRNINGISFALFSVLTSAYLIFSIVFYLLMYFSSTNRYKLFLKQFDYFLEEVSIIEINDRQKIKNTYLEEPYKVLQRTLDNLGRFLGVSNIVLISILVGYFAFIFL